MKAYEVKRKQEELKLQEQIKQIEEEVDTEIVKIVRNGFTNKVDSLQIYNDLKSLLS